MNGNTKKNNIKRDERICILYGICGNQEKSLESHLVSQFGLNCLNKEKEKK
ncbi:MAG TPA: hypothetical protein P5556_05550 [Candidatus Gastranaerophilales bacterium]|nr:hypothetical protein [Candidatus Gastranaerophilales bacterium]